VRPSIRRRLLTLSVGATLLTVGAAGAMIWFMMSRALRQSMDESLRTTAIEVAARVEDESGRIEFDLDSGEEPFPEGSALICIMDEAGQPIYCSRELRDEVLPRTVPTEISANVYWFDARFKRIDGPQRGVALYATARQEGIRGAGSTRMPRHVWVYVVRSVEPLNATLRGLAGILMTTVGLASVVATCLGILLARRGTKPIREVANAIEQIRADHPMLAIDRRSVVVELDPIVGTIDGLLARIGAELERQRQLTADVAHDLRTPLAGVRTLLDVCTERPRDACEYRETIGKAQGALRQLSDLVDNILTLARLDAAIDRPHWTPVSLRVAVEAAHATVRPLAETQGVTVQVVLQSSDLIQSDQAKLTKILSNLLCNAIEHSPQGGVATVTARDDAGTIEIAVVDRGLGVRPADSSCIFERFVRGDSARSGEGHHGLGLPIARGLAQLLGGDVELDQTYQEGARFVLRLPRRPA